MIHKEDRMKEKTSNFVYIFFDRGFSSNLLLQENLVHFVEKGDIFEIYKRFSKSIRRKILKN